MLPKKSRIKRQEFPDILATARRYNSPHLLLYVSKKNPSKTTQFSFSVSKKVSKLATTRNTYRRRGYSVINKYKQSINTGYVCFFVFKKSLQSASFAILDKEISVLLREAFVLL